MVIESLRFYGDTKRKVYREMGEIELKRVIPKFAAIPGKRFVGDPNKVLNLLNHDEALQHNEYKENSDIISGLNIQLKDYQKRGVEWMLDMENKGKNGVHGGLSCDEMGLGKTVQTIALMLSNCIFESLRTSEKRVCNVFV